MEASVERSVRMRNARMVAMLVLILIGCRAASAQPRREFGVGLMVGEPTGLSFKSWLNGSRAIAGGLAWSFSENDSLHVHADYLVHRFDILGAQDAPGRVPLYCGLGGRLKLREEHDGRGRNDNDDIVGLRIPLGIAYLFADAPLDAFAEIVPVLDLVPDIDFDLNAAVGVRFYF